MAVVSNYGTVPLHNVTLVSSNVSLSTLDTNSHKMLEVSYPIGEHDIYEAALIINTSVVAYIIRSNGSTVYASEGYPTVVDIPSVNRSVSLETLPTLHAYSMCAVPHTAWLAMFDCASA